MIDEAAAEWARVVPGLEALDVAEARGQVAGRCRLRNLVPATSPSRRFALRGLTLANPDSGRAHKHPAQSVVEVAGAQLRVLAAEFGLTPSSEQ